MINHSNTFIGKEDLNVVEKLIKNKSMTVGYENKMFQQELSSYLGSDFIKLTNSGTMAFLLILMALDIRKGDEILLPDYICNDLLGPIYALGAIPKLYDNQENSWLSSDKQILSKVTSKTKVVVVNHTFGFLFKDIDSLSSLIPSHVNIIEDCCHAIIGINNTLNKFTRKSSLCCFYSFNATKMLSAGEGGAISSNDIQFIKKINNINIGSKLSDINCAFARLQLNKMDYFISKRRNIANRYATEFPQLLEKNFLKQDSVYFRFPIITINPARFWQSKNVSYRKGVDSLLSSSIRIKAMPNANKMIETTVSLPIYPSMSDYEVEMVINDVKFILNQ